MTMSQLFPTSLEDMEALLGSLGDLSDRLVLFDAQQVRATGDKLLVEASAAQWIATWTRASAGRIRINSSGNEVSVDLLKRISDTLPGALIGMLDEASVEDVSRTALARFRDAFFKQQRSWPDLSVRDSAVLLCLDNIPSKIGLAPQLYSSIQGGAVASRDHFAHLIDKLIKSVTAESNVQGEITKHRERLTTILHELFKNTHDHARTTVDKRPLSLSIRGPYARFYSAAKLAYTSPPVLRDEGGNEVIPQLNQAERYASYFVRTKGASNPLHSSTLSRNFLGLLELSVFDTGPGFAATYLKKDFSGSSVTDQFNAVLGCFSTGKSATGDESRGYGLWKVLRDLRALKGFIRVRTNKVHVYRDFAWYGDMFMQSEIVAPQERMMDWRRGITKKITEDYPDMQGSQVSVLIPLGENL